VWGGYGGYIEKHHRYGRCFVEWFHVLCPIGQLDVSRGTGRKWIFGGGVVQSHGIGAIQCDSLFVSEYEYKQFVDGVFESTQHVDGFFL
jgi:hypothetical protein